MKEKHIYNLDVRKISKIVVRDKNIDPDFIYKPFKKRLIPKDRHEGFKIDGGFYYYLLSEFGEKWPHHMIIDKKVYFKPNVQIYFDDNSYIRKSFYTIELALEFANSIAIPNSLIIDFE